MSGCYSNIDPEDVYFEKLLHRYLDSLEERETDDDDCDDDEEAYWAELEADRKRDDRLTGDG